MFMKIFQEVQILILVNFSAGTSRLTQKLDLFFFLIKSRRKKRSIRSKVGARRTIRCFDITSSQYLQKEIWICHANSTSCITNSVIKKENVNAQPHVTSRLFGLLNIYRYIGWYDGYCYVKISHEKRPLLGREGRCQEILCNLRHYFIFEGKRKGLLRPFFK